MGYWHVTLKITDCESGAAIANAGVNTGFALNTTNQYGEVGFAVDTSVDWFIARVTRENYIYREYPVYQTNAGDTVAVCLEKVVPSTPTELAAPTQLKVDDYGSGHISVSWTDPVPYSRHLVGWQRPGGAHQQLPDLGGAARSATIRASFRPGETYRLKVKGGVSKLFGYKYSPWTELVWTYPTPSPRPPAWYEHNKQQLGPVFLASSTGAAAWGPNRIDVFHGVRGKKQVLGHTWWSGSSWQSEELDGGTGDEVYGFSAVSRGDHRLDVFYNSQRSLWHKAYDGTAWLAPVKLGGVLKPGRTTSAISWGGERIDVFYQGPENQLVQRAYDNGGWSGEVHLGQTVGHPAVASTASGRLNLFHRGTDDRLHHTWWDGQRWSHALFGGTTDRSPAAVSWGQDRLDVFYRRPDGYVCQKYRDRGTWSGEVRLSNQPINLIGLSAASWAPKRLDLFYVTFSPVALWHHWFNG